MNKNLLIGVSQIDHQHSEIFRSFQHLLLISPSDEAISEVLSRLTTQIHNHFQTEEAFMAGLGIPASERLAHLNAHSKIIEDLAAIHIETMFGTRVPFDEILNRVSIYVNEHVIEFDLGLKPYISLA